MTTSFKCCGMNVTTCLCVQGMGGEGGGQECREARVHVMGESISLTWKLNFRGNHVNPGLLMAKIVPHTLEV